MQTFNQSLANAYFQKLITLEVALARSSNPDELQDLINRGVTSPQPGAGKFLYAVEPACSRDRLRGGMVMPVFTYRGTNKTGATVQGERTAATKAELAAMLRREQINVNKLSEKGKEFNIPTFGGGVDSKELAIFTRQFSVMIDAGLPLVQCLEILAGQQENKTFQKVLNGVRGSVEGGATLSASHEAVREGVRPSVLQHGGSGRDGRYFGHHSAAPLQLHRKERKAEARRAVGDDLSDRRLGIAGGVIILLLWKVVPIFTHVVQRPGCGLAASHAHRDHAEQLRRQHLRLHHLAVLRRTACLR